MAILIVEHDGKVEAGFISGRVVIGRRAESQIRAADRTLAPIHAWIGTAENGACFIADSGSEAGTFVNDERVVIRKELTIGDRIRIGPLSMKLADGDTIPLGATPIDLHARPTPVASPAKGISFDCTCGAPMWVPWSAAGKRGRCQICGASLVVPRPPAPPDSNESIRPVQSAVCGVCHGVIAAGESTTRCPDCSTVFHVECWTENGGCSVYGCSQVNTLSPATREPEEDQSASLMGDADLANTDRTHLAHGILAISVLAALGGALTYGIPALLMAGAALLYLIRAKPQKQRRVVFLSIAFSMTAALLGAAISYYWWIGGKAWLATR